MYLSLLPVDYQTDADCPGFAWLKDLYSVHQRLWMAFPDQNRLETDPFFLGPWKQKEPADQNPPRDRGGFLFRIERDGSPRILVQSINRPNWEYAFKNTPWLLSGECKIREFEPSCELGMQYRFRLLANVVDRISVPTEEKKTTMRGIEIFKKKRIEQFVPDNVTDPFPSDLDEQQLIMRQREQAWWNWLEKLGQTYGFQLSDKASVAAPFIAIHRRKRHESSEWKMRFNAVRFEGTLSCSNPEMLNSTIINGIGRAKAFGFGLLSLAPA